MTSKARWQQKKSFWTWGTVLDEQVSGVSIAGWMWISVTPAGRSASASVTRRREPARQSWSKWSGNTTPSSVASRRNGNPAWSSVTVDGSRIGNSNSTARSR